MRGHHPAQTALRERRERDEILGGDGGEAALVARQLVVRIRGDVAVPGKVLADRRHPLRAKSGDEGRGEMRRGVGIAMERAIADHAACAMVEVEHRREREIDAMVGKLARDRGADPVRFPRRPGDIAIPSLAQRAHRRDRGEALAKALHAPAFMVDADQELRVAHAPDRCRQRRELRRRRVVPREQDHAAGRRMRQAGAVGRRQFEPLDAVHHGAERQRSHGASRFPAASRSSDFIWRTASRRPTKIERDTIAWPMWSSRMPGSAATGCTLK